VDEDLDMVVGAINEDGLVEKLVIFAGRIPPNCGRGNGE